jgi:predicted dehydrogenase
VLTPPVTHERIVRECLANDRHVIVEKPIALSNEVFRCLWHLASTRGLRLIENHNYRFNKPILKMDRAISSGRIGKVEEVEVRMVLDVRSGGRYADENLPHPSHQLPAGVIHEFISHLSYLLLHFIPASDPDEFDSIRAMWRNQGGGDVFKYDDLDATVSAGRVRGRIRFASHQWPDCLMVQVRGSAGVASAELFHPTMLLTSKRPVGRHLMPLLNAMVEARAKALSGIGSIWHKLHHHSTYEGLERFLHRTYEALQCGDEPPVTFDQMDRTTRLIDAMLAPENRE